MNCDHPSIAPNAASPMIGHGVAPLEPPVSLIDFHGQRDKIIPFDADKLGSKARALISEIKIIINTVKESCQNLCSCQGKGPHNSLISSNYYYYEQKPDTIARWVEQMGCGGPEKYPTGRCTTGFCWQSDLSFNV